MKANAELAPTDQVRTAVRFPIELPLRIVTPDGVLDATTVDISSNGILFYGMVIPPVDSIIEFTIEMPAGIMGAATDVTIQCVGRVVRNQEKDGRLFAAAIIDEYFLRN